ncbi:MAG: cupin domain-containing protein [Campylobacterales bacterium]|nr:cupin domain-containing protein [Campylobacterales bacterium]
MALINSSNLPFTKLEAGSGASMQMLISNEVAPNFAMRKFTIEAGGFMPNHTNSVEHEQYVLSGRARVGLGEKVVEAKAGDALYIAPGLNHWYEVLGDEPYVFLCLVPNKPDEIKILN